VLAYMKWCAPGYRCRCGLEPKGSRWWHCSRQRLPGKPGMHTNAASNPQSGIIGSRTCWLANTSGCDGSI